MRNRLPGLLSAVEIISDIVGEEYARAMAGDNPQAVANDQWIPLCPVPQIPKKKKKWFFF
jgi:hypothetical protein